MKQLDKVDAVLKMFESVAQTVKSFTMLRRKWSFQRKSF